MFEYHIKHCNSTVKQHHDSIRLLNLKIKNLNEIVNNRRWPADDPFLENKRFELNRLLKEKDTLEFHLSRAQEILKFWKSLSTRQETRMSVRENSVGF